MQMVCHKKTDVGPRSQESYREEGFITIKSTSRMVKKAGLNYGLTLRTIISHDCPGDPFFQVATCASCHRMNEAGTMSSART